MDPNPDQTFIWGLSSGPEPRPKLKTGPDNGLYPVLFTLGPLGIQGLVFIPICHEIFIKTSNLSIFL